METSQINFFSQVEKDQDIIDEILYRRHTGSLNGVGQSKWDDRMKDNFVQRSGKTTGINIADEIEYRLSDANLLPSKKIPRSNLNRFLSSEFVRNRIGFSIKNKEFQFTHNPKVVLNTFKCIADDFSQSYVVLGDIWDNNGKQKYLEKLESRGVLPTNTDVIPTDGKHKPAPKVKSKPKQKPKIAKRDTLIPQKDYGILWTGKLQRHEAIWQELQFHLNTKSHPNAISVLFRVLLELSVDHYIQTHKTQVHENDKLAKRVEKVGNALFNDGKIDKKQYTATKKFGQLDQLVSADTLNRYVHSSSFAPSADHLQVLWDTMVEFIINCLNE